MDVLIVLVFVSLLFVCGAILLFCVSLHQRDFEHGDRLSLLPLTDSSPSARPAIASAPPLAGGAAADVRSHAS